MYVNVIFFCFNLFKTHMDLLNKKKKLYHMNTLFIIIKTNINIII